MPSSTQTPYLIAGRLADVVAAIQVMGMAQRPEGEITALAQQLSRSSSDVELDRWRAVFKDHGEFFLVYKLDGNEKAALRLRYVNKNYDSDTGIAYSPIERRQLTKDHRFRLTTLPLSSDAVTTLVGLAIELHSRALAERSERRWWIPLVTALLSVAVGAGLTALATPNEPPRPPSSVYN